MTITVIICLKCHRERPDDSMPCECEGGPNRHELAMKSLTEAGRRLRMKYEDRWLKSIFGDEPRSA